MSISLVDLAKDYVKGTVEFVDDNMRQDRINICNTCEYKTNVGTCRLCGCIIKAKTRYTKSECPVKKW